MLAQNLEQIQKTAIPNFTFQGGSLGDIISKSLPYLFSIAGILLLLYLLWGGLSLMVSAGDPKGIEAARARITNAVIGLFIILLAFVLVRIIGTILGIQAIKNIFG